MKTVYLSLTGGALATIALGVAMCDRALAAEATRAHSDLRTAFAYDSYSYSAQDEQPSPSPSDRPLPEVEEENDYGPVPATPPGACGPAACQPAACDPSCAAACGAPACGRPRCDCGCGKRACGCGGVFGCNIGDAWELPEPCALQRRGIEWGGWVQTGILANARGRDTNGPLGFNDRAQFDAHQVWFYLDKDVDTSRRGWDVGGHVDLVFGVDGPDTTAFGDQDWDFSWDTSRDYGWAMPQLYATLGVGDWTIKGGHFYTNIGYEVVPAPDNFFYSHSYAQYYAEPFTHTGVLVERSIGDRLSVSGGWVSGWDGGFRNLNSASMFIGGVSYELSDRASLAWACTAGDFGDGTRSGNQGDLYMNSIVFEYALTDRWTYVFQHDLGANDNIPGSDDTEWYGINQYLLYQLNDCWAAGMRIEWFRDDDGARVAGRPGANVGDFYELTFGLNYKPHANLTIRPELRYDWFDGTGTPFPGGHTDQFAGGFDLIATW